jgi:hypothetical protein
MITQPVGQLDDRRLAVQHDPAAEHADIEVAGAGNVRGDDEVGEHQPFAGAGKSSPAKVVPPARSLRTTAAT